jgi:hypothetical protein
LILLAFFPLIATPHRETVVMIINGCAGIEDFSGLLFLFELSEHDNGQDHQQKQSKYDSWPHQETPPNHGG